MVKNLPTNAEDARGLGLISRSGRSPGGEDGNSLQYSCLGNPMDRGTWWATVCGATELDMTEVTQHTQIPLLFVKIPGGSLM